MAKVIRLSDDAGSTWSNLPGSEGSFNSEAEAIDDTILGQTYQSSEIGLVGWGINANGIFKGFAGYLAEIKRQGTSTAATGEAFTLVSGKTYAINNAAKEIFDRATAITVYDNAVDHTADVESIDYLFGRITFKAAYTVTGPVTADLNYFPVSALGKANTYTLTMTAEAIDETDFGTAQANGGNRVFSPGLRTVALELGGIFSAAEDFKADLAARNEIIVEVDPAGDGSSVARGFFKLATTGQSGAVGALEEETVSLALTVPDETSNPAVALPFNWRHTNSTLSAAIQIAINAWLSELATTKAQYLPSGATGQSPLDGVDGAVVFTDISLSGGLSNMNVFTMDMQGTGAFTEV